MTLDPDRDGESGRWQPSDEPTARVEAHAVNIIAELKALPDDGSASGTWLTGAPEDFAALKRSLDARLPYAAGELAGLGGYEESLRLLLEKLRNRLETGHSYLASVDTLHSLSLSVDTSRFVMSAVIDTSLDTYLDTTLAKFGPLIDLVWRHCVGYPGANPDGTYDADSRTRFRAWIAGVLVDPAAKSSLLYVRRSNLRSPAMARA